MGLIKEKSPLTPIKVLLHIKSEIQVKHTHIVVSSHKYNNVTLSPLLVKLITSYRAGVQRVVCSGTVSSVRNQKPLTWFRVPCRLMAFQASLRRSCSSPWRIRVLRRVSAKAVLSPTILITQSYLLPSIYKSKLRADVCQPIEFEKRSIVTASESVVKEEFSKQFDSPGTVSVWKQVWAELVGVANVVGARKASV